MVLPTLPVSPAIAVTVSDLRSLRQLAESGQLKTWQAGAVLDVVVNRREGGLLLLTSKQGSISLPVPADRSFPPGTALQLQVLALAPLQIQLRPAGTAGQSVPLAASANLPIPTVPSTPPATGMAAAPAALVAAATSAPAAPVPLPLLHVLREHLQTVLKSPAAEQTAFRQIALTTQLEQWLTRLSAWQPVTEPELADPNRLPMLARQLLQSLPRAEHASEPDELETLLRQALFGQPPATSATVPGRAANTDWLSALLKLLQATTAASPAPTAKLASTPAPLPPVPPTAAGATQTNRPGPERAAAELAAPSAGLPLPADDLLDELASLLGRQQQHWLNNVQQDMRQQPLYAELLLRQQERLDRIEISVRADRDADAETVAGAPHHVVRLRFDLPGLGICQFLLDLNSDALQLHFYSEHADAAAAFDQHLDWLAQQLAADGVQLSAAHSHTVAQLPSLQPTLERGLHVQV